MRDRRREWGPSAQRGRFRRPGSRPHRPANADRLSQRHAGGDGHVHRQSDGHSERYEYGTDRHGDEHAAGQWNADDARRDSDTGCQSDGDRRADRDGINDASDRHLDAERHGDRERQRITDRKRDGQRGAGHRDPIALRNPDRFR